MTAFGIGELSGTLAGLSLGHAWVVTLKAFFGLIVAAIVLFGVWYWNEQFNKSDIIKSFIDFVKPAIWFIYVSAVSYLFFTTYTAKLEFYPAFIDAKTFENGIQVVTPDGKKELVDADKPYKSYQISGVPLLYSLLEPADALEVVLTSQLTLSVDKTGWDGYFANDVTPSRVFSKCAFNSISQSDYYDVKAFFCKRAPGVLNLGLVNFINPFDMKLDELCGGMVGDDEKVLEKYKACLDETEKKFNDNVDSRIDQLNTYYKNGKIDEQTYASQKEKLKETKVKIDEIFESLKENSDPYWSSLAEKFFQTASTVPQRPTTEGKLNAIKEIIEGLGRFTTQAFVGEYLLLDLFEGYQKLALTVELGFLIPVLFLLSMLPNANSPTGSYLKYAFYGVGVYFLVKLTRVFVFLIYLMVHNYFLQNAVG